MTMTFFRLALLLAAVSLTACATLNPPKPGDSTEYRPAAPIVPIPPASNHGAIFQAAQGQGLFEDYKARRVGDLVTVVLAENTNAKKSAVTSTSKKGETGSEHGQHQRRRSADPHAMD